MLWQWGELLMFNKKNVYGMEFICSNCDEKQTVKIRKGISVSKFMITKKAECRCCGIKALHTYEDYLMKKKMWEQMMQEEVFHPNTETDLYK